MRRLALVTGGAVRLGAAISRSLADAGYTVVVHANAHLEQAREVATGIGGVALAADLTDRAAIDRLFAELDQIDGQLEVLVNNAAIFEPADQATVDADTWDRHLELNLSAPFRCAQNAVPRMRAAGRGSIVNLLDIAATRPYARCAHYGATKAGLVAFTRGWAVDWAPEIRVNGVAPGAALMPEWYSEADRQKRLDRIPQGVEPGADAVAETVRFLVTGPRAVTGQIIAVDGGRSAAW
jgi:pteridine reductase